MGLTIEKWLGDNQLGIDIWKNKYQHNNETLDEWFERVSGGDKEVEKLIRDKKFLFGGRALTNRGTTNKGSMFNCYSSGYAEDNIEDLMQLNTNLALTYKAQGGQGVSLSKIRPKGTPIGKYYTSDGIIPFMEIFNTTTSSIQQGGSRKGALMMSIDIRHKEAEEFIKIKTNNDRITKANLSLEVDDEFMKAVETYYKTGEVITFHEVRYYGDNKEHKVEYDIIPIKLYKLMMQMAWDMGEPGYIASNRFRNYNLMEFDDEYQIVTCNPCFAGDMRLLTVDGYKTFEELCDTEPYIYNVDGNIVKSKVWCSGEKDTVLIKTGVGNIVCTPNHKFMTINGEECRAENLKGKYIMPFTVAHTELDEEFIKMGFIQGDGQLSRLSDVSAHQGIEVNIGEKDTDIFDLFANEEYTVKNHRAIYLKGWKDKLISLGFSHSILPTREFPTTYNEWTKKQKASFLQGCYSANGAVIKNGRISYKTTCRKFVEQLVETLNKDFDIQDVYITTNKAHMCEFKNGSYSCRESYDVSIGKYKEITKFIAQIGFYQQYKRKQLAIMMENRPTYVYNVTPYKKMKVYDFTEPLRHWGIVEGYVVHNCGEQPMPKNFSCNLGSLNLAEFINDPYTKTATFNIEEFKKAVGIGIKALDTIIDENLKNHALKEQAYNSENYRNVGLGLFGYANALFELGITYGSSEALEFTKIVFSTMLYEALKESNALAKKRGMFNKCKPKLIAKANIIQNLKKYISANKIEELINDIEKYGLRNCSLLSIAPNGSIATMLGMTGGCEPEFALSYIRKTDNLNDSYEIYSKAVKDYWALTDDAIDKGNIASLPKYFKTSKSLQWKDRINTQSIMQEFIDTAISSTVNLPKETTVEEVEQLYLYAWKQGLKGITIFRDGCARAGILTTETKNEDEQTQTELKRGDIVKVDTDLIGKKRKLNTGCGSLHCTAFFDKNTGELRETYLSKGSSGGCQNYMIGLSRMMSLAARGGISVYDIVDQLSSTGVCPSYAVRSAKYKDTSKGSCCPMAVGNALTEMYEEMQNELLTKTDIKGKEVVKTKDNSMTYEECIDSMICPECGEELISTGGCVSCKACAFSKCD